MSTKKDETRLRLLDEARKLLAKRGFHDVGLDQIAEAAGVSRQAVYKSHFASKPELLLALVRHVHDADKLDELARPAYEARSAREMLAETIRAVVRIETRIHDLSRVLAAAATSDAGAAAAYRDRMEVKRGAFRMALSRAVAEGLLVPTWTLEEAVDLLAALVSIDSYHQLVIERGWKEAEMIERFIETAEKTLLVAPEPATQRARRAR